VSDVHALACILRFSLLDLDVRLWSYGQTSWRLCIGNQPATATCAAGLPNLERQARYATLTMSQLTFLFVLSQQAGVSRYKTNLQYNDDTSYFIYYFKTPILVRCAWALSVSLKELFPKSTNSTEHTICGTGTISV